MEGSNFFTSKFGSKSMKEKKKRRVYFQRKINTEKYPNIQKILKSFFNDSNNYFHTNFEDQRIIVGKQYNKHNYIFLIVIFIAVLIGKKIIKVV